MDAAAAVKDAASPRDHSAAPPPHGARSARAVATRAAIMEAAERMFAERGVSAVSNRQIAEAAGQANNTAVAYHFGTREDLVREIIRVHADDIDARRAEILERVRGSSDIRAWLEGLVLPSTGHLGALAPPTWYARFSEQVLADPELRELIYEDAMASASLQEILGGLRVAAGHLPLDVRRTRAHMARELLVHVTAERERMLALAQAGEGDGTPVGTWEELGIDLVDALTGLWSAPVTR